MIKNTGKDSEAIFESVLTGQGAHVYRFEDYLDVTKGHRNKRKIVSKKPSDFIVTLHGLTAFTEVKSISTGKRFDFSRIERGQWAAALKVTREQANGLYYFYLHFLESDKWYQVPAERILKSTKQSIREDEITDCECYMVHTEQQSLARS